MFITAGWTVVAVAGFVLFAVLVFAAGMVAHDRAEYRAQHPDMPRATAREFLRSIRF